MKRSAGELGLAPKECICDPFDLAALGHMLNCPCSKPKTKPAEFRKMMGLDIKNEPAKLAPIADAIRDFKRK